MSEAKFYVNIKNFLESLNELMKDHKIEIETFDVTIRDKNNNAFGYLENNFDTLDVVLDDQVVASVDKG